MSSDILLYSLLTAFVILNILDGHSTLKVIKKTSYKNERNPIARLLFKLLGPLAGVIVLKSVLIPAIIIAIHIFLDGKNQINLLLIIANFFYLAVVIHNYNVVKRINRHKIMMKELDIDDE